MNKQSQFRVTAVAMVVAILIISLISVFTSGKTKLKYTANVIVKSGAVEGDGRQAIYIKAPGEECDIEVTVDGQAGIQSDVGFYRDSTMSDPYLTVTPTKDSTKFEKVKLDSGAIFVVVTQKLAGGSSLADGTYAMDYVIRINGASNMGRVFLLLLLACVIAALFLIILRHEDDKENTVSKKQLRMRRKAFMNGFFVLVMMILLFALFSASVEQFPFTMYQAGMISIIVALTVFFMAADMSNAYTGIRQRRGSLILIFGIVAVVNLVVALFGLFANKASEITPVGNGMVGNWIVNLITALCFAAMVLEMIRRNNETGSRTSARSPRVKSDYPEYGERIDRGSYEARSEAKREAVEAARQRKARRKADYDDDFVDE